MEEKVVEEKTQDIIYSHTLFFYKKFFIRTKSLTVERLIDKLCKRKYKKNPLLKEKEINDWLIKKIRLRDGYVSFTGEEYEEAFNSFKKYLFQGLI